MKRAAALLAPAVCLGLTATAVTATTASAGGRPINVTLAGAEEVPGPGDPDGTGTASFRIRLGQKEVCYTLTVSDVEPIFAAHIHLAPAGVAGPVVVPLAPPTSGTSSACAEVSRELARDLFKNPENYYVNVHNTSFPAGALRAQLG